MPALGKIEVEMMVVVGSAEMPLQRLLKLTRGAVIPLGQDASEPLTILANGRAVAKGRVVLNGERVSVEVSGDAPRQRPF